MKLEIVLLVLGALLMLGALVAGLVRRSFLSLAAVFVLAGFALGQGGLEVLEFDARSGFVHDLAVDRADRDPVPRRPRGRGGDAPEGVAPPVPQARARDADHGRAGRGVRALGRRPRLARVLPARRAAVADRPGALLLRGHEPARAAARAPLAQPRVRAQRRPRAAGGPGLHRGARRRRRLRVVGVRPPGRDARVRVRRRAGVGGLEADAARAPATDRSRRTRSRSTRSASPSRSTASRSACRRRATASSPSSPARSRSGSCAPTCARASSTAPRRSWRSSSSGSSSCSARC